MRRFVVLAAVGVVAGCANPVPARREQRTQWIGRPELALVQAMGVPTRTYATGGLKFLSYVDQRVEIVPGSPFYGDPFWYGYSGGFPPTVVNLACDTTFTIGGGIVRSFTLRGNACG